MACVLLWLRGIPCYVVWDWMYGWCRCEQWRELVFSPKRARLA